MLSPLFILLANSLIYFPKNNNTFVFDHQSIVKVIEYDTTVEAYVYSINNGKNYEKRFSVVKPRDQHFIYTYPYKKDIVFVMKSNIDEAVIFHYKSTSFFTYLKFDLVRYNVFRDELVFYNKQVVSVYKPEEFWKSLTLELSLTPIKVFNTVQSWDDFQFFDNFVLYKKQNMTYAHPNTYIDEGYGFYFKKVTVTDLRFKKIFCFILSILIMIFILFR